MTFKLNTLTAALAAALVVGCAQTPPPAVTTPPPVGTSTPAATGTRTPTDGTNDAAPPSGEARDPSATPTGGSPTPDRPRSTPNLGSAAMIQPVDHIAAPPGSPVIQSGYSGAKVNLIQQKFGIDETIQLMDAVTMAAVEKFQSDNGLDVSGQVGKQTWQAMFPDIPWTIDQYQATPTLPTTASASARIEAMIAYARSVKGAEYVWGAAGPKTYGFDCSGLLLQAMYAAGLDPEPINVVDHQKPRYPTASYLYEYDRFKKVPVDQRKRGDFVFYGPPGRITHVVLFLGDGYVLEALPSKGVSEDKFYESWHNHGNLYSMKEYAIRVTE